MEKSKYGKQIAYLWKGNATNEQICLKEVSSTLYISEDKKEEIEKSFQEAKLKNPNFFDGTLWRYEGINNLCGGVEFLLSPTTYMPHNILRHEDYPISVKEGKFKSNYPNPFSINSLQITADNYILIGVKGNKSDQRGLGVMGAGFIKRNIQRGNNLPPEDIFQAALRESNEETAYANNTAPIEEDINNFRALGTIFGSNHDTTACIYVPLNAKKSEVDIGNLEHSDLFFLKNDKKSLENFLNEGGMKGVPAVDHLIGCIELYYNLK